MTAFHSLALPRRIEGWKKFRVYIARTIMAPSKMSVQGVLSGDLRPLRNFDISVLTEIRLGGDDRSTPAIGEFLSRLSEIIPIERISTTHHYTID